MHITDLINWLQAIGADADPATPGFQASVPYLLACIGIPVLIGLAVGFGLRAIENLFGVQLGRGGGH